MHLLHHKQRLQARLPLRRKSGFSLIEVVVATFVLGLCIAGSLISLQMAFGMVEQSRDQTMATQFLQAEIETLRLKNWAELTDMPAEEEFVVHGEFGQEVAQRFRCVRRIRDARPGVEIKIVTVEATWTSRNGVSRELIYETRISKNGINDYYYRTLPPE